MWPLRIGSGVAARVVGGDDFVLKGVRIHSMVIVIVLLSSKKRKRKAEVIQEVFVKENSMHRNLSLPERVVGGWNLLTYSSQRHHQGSQSLLEDLLASYDGYQLICRGNTLKVLKRVGDSEILVMDEVDVITYEEDNLVDVPRKSHVEKSELVAMFCTDKVAKCNYKEFGDIVSFDATFITNKYNMVFVPITWVDNQRMCMTGGLEIILREDEAAYTWLLSNGKAKNTLYKKAEKVVQECDNVAEYKVVRSLEDGSVECTCRHFLYFRFLCQHILCVMKKPDIEVIMEKYILRCWRSDIIPPALRRNTNKYGEKNETITKLTNEAILLDDCLFLLSKDEDQLVKSVEQLKTIKKEVVVQVPNPPS
ncbi:zinc finger, SWIM-type containing protein [Tanacetum coccineum]